MHQPDFSPPPTLEVDLASIPFRQPIVDEYDPAIHNRQPGDTARDLIDRIDAHEQAVKRSDTEVDREWTAVTEAARRAIIGSAETRHIAAGFTSEPLGEGLPQKAVDEIAASDVRTARLLRLTHGKLGVVLGLPEVPNEAIVPDIDKAPGLKRREDTVRSMSRWWRDGPETYSEMLDHTRQQVERSPGLSSAEKELVARRYRYARDVKMLGLMAELHDQPMESAQAEDGLITHQLSSGTKLVMTEEARASTPSLLDPQAWESRKQIHDRVYMVGINGEEYILKERKTTRHVSTVEGGHIDGLTSEQEFRVAQEFADLGTIRHGDIELRWEKPLGYVEFPDGFQFCLFESEPGMSTDRSAPLLAREILAARGEYEAEYQEVSQRAKEIYEQRKDLLWNVEPDAGTLPPPKRVALSRAARRHKRLYNEQQEQPESQPDELTFEEFAGLTASHMVDDAFERLHQTVLDRGYVDRETDGYGLKLRKGNRPTLEVIGFDFEYYKTDPESAAQITRNMQDNNERGISAQLHASFKVPYDRAITRAASYAMLERNGFKLPPESDQ